MNVWIVPYQPKNDVYNKKYFGRDGKRNWEKKYNYEIGDIVYLYESSPTQAVRYKCQIIDVDYYTGDYGSYERSRLQDYRYTKGPFAEFKLLYEFELDGQTSYKNLKKVGLISRIQGSLKPKQNVISYLEAVERNQTNNESSIEYLQTLSLEDLKALAKKDGSKQPKYIEASRKEYYRSNAVSVYAKRRANGICQLCGNKAPFNDKYGYPYLESHHVRWLSDGGADEIKNVVALCPNCHRKMHVVADKKDIKKLLNIAKEND